MQWCEPTELTLARVLPKTGKLNRHNSIKIQLSFMLGLQDAEHKVNLGDDLCPQAVP